MNLKLALLMSTSFLLFACQPSNKEHAIASSQIKSTNQTIQPLPTKNHALLISQALNASYRIEQTEIFLNDGKSIVEDGEPDSGQIITQVYGEPTLGDINHDGLDDVLFFLTQRTDGTGTFFYLATAIQAEEGLLTSNAFFLGDRIKPQKIVLQNDFIVAEYLTRGINEPFSHPATSSQQTSVKYDAETHQLVEVFFLIGEADPDRMTLDMKVWQWVKTQYNNDTEIIPLDKTLFTLTIFENGDFSGTTDCNSFHSTMILSEKRITFEQQIATTSMFCADAQESIFLRSLQQVDSYFFTAKGQLIFQLKMDSGVMIFN